MGEQTKSFSLRRIDEAKDPSRFSIDEIHAVNTDVHLTMRKAQATVSRDDCRSLFEFLHVQKQI